METALVVIVAAVAVDEVATGILILFVFAADILLMLLLGDILLLFNRDACWAAADIEVACAETGDAKVADETEGKALVTSEAVWVLLLPLASPPEELIIFDDTDFTPLTVSAALVVAVTGTPNPKPDVSICVGLLEFVDMFIIVLFGLLLFTVIVIVVDRLPTG